MPRGRFTLSTTNEEIERRMRADEATYDTRRRSGRVSPDRIRCNLGRVIDLSATGLRLRSTRHLKGPQMVMLVDGDYSLRVRARIIWAMKHGFRRHEIGLQFVEVSADDAAMLRAMALSS